MQRIILDTDIGTDVDDAMALALALASPELELLGVTTVHGDAPFRARIARRLLALAGREDVPVVAGASLPLAMPLPENFHWMPRLRGHEGVGFLEETDLIHTANIGASDPEPASGGAARFIVETAARFPGELSLVAIGALTNVARALRLEPRLAGQLRGLTLMGGTVDTDRFPWPPMLETNLNADPLAAEIVFASGLPLTVVPMEVTTQVFLTPEDRARLRGGSTVVEGLLGMMEGMLTGMAGLTEEVGLAADFYEGRTFMHDPLAVAVAFGSSLATVEARAVSLEVVDRVVRTMPKADREPNLRLCVDVDAPAFVDFWLERVAALPLKPS